MKIEEASFYHARITDWPEGERPREKLMQLGPARLSDSELLAILLRTGTKTQTAVDLAKTIVTRYGNLQDLSEMEYQEFFRLKGIGPVKAVTLIAAFEVARRIASLPLKQKLKVTDPKVVYNRYEPLMSHLKKELFTILILNSANVLLRDVQISEGTLNSSLVHPREVFRSAILESAASIVLLHNHPSGEVEPSREDKNITQRLVEAGKMLDMPVLDHIIIGHKNYFSFRQAGLIGEQ
ncbi:DNA repair protein RadC [Candidatus Saccharibacteria bacterium]|nr:DNA repair protein RadC [Calditrichia bacterium]NIV72399.1 DNA repair protein RadC [Calditrichia bacterium]NIV99463.1 DNA repair protein RadC [Candidatus Saccharibacteria bacterium]